MHIEEILLNNNKAKKYDIIRNICTFLFIFMCHFVTFFSVFPGICYYDLNEQINQYILREFCTNHPIIHTLFEGFFYSQFENHNTGYAFATIIQLLIVDGAMVYALSFLWKKLGKKWLYYLAIVFYAMWPLNSLLAVSHTKDIIFSAFAFLLFIDIYRYMFDEGVKTKWCMARIVAWSVCASFFRNNAIYATAVMAVVLLIVVFVGYKRQNSDKKTVHLTVTIAVSCVVAIMAGKLVVFATDGAAGTNQEMMSVPCQIMARIYNTTATDEEKEIITQYIEEPAEYEYYLSDGIKKQLPFSTFDSKCKHFLLDSTIIALHHPIQSIEAVWFNVQGFFDPFHMPYGYEHFFLASCDYRGGATADSKLARLGNFYYQHFRVTTDYRSNPIIILLNIGFYIWLVIVAMIIDIRKGNGGIIPYLFPMLYLGTLLLGPGAIARYGYLFIMMAPIAMGLAISRKSGDKD